MTDLTCNKVLMMREYILKRYYKEIKKVNEEVGVKILLQLSGISNWDDIKLEAEYESWTVFEGVKEWKNILQITSTLRRDIF